MIMGIDDANNLMIDIETLGTRSNSVIMSVGAVLFDLKDYREVLLHRKISIQSCLDVGLQVDGNTIEWWLKQSPENIERLMTGERYQLSTVLHELSSLSLYQKQWYVWSHGSIFDIVLLENAYKAAGFSTWWNYKNVRDTRTLFDVANYKYSSEGKEVKHDALEDAMNQAKAVQAAYTKLRGEQNGSN